MLDKNPFQRTIKVLILLLAIIFVPYFGAHHFIGDTGSVLETWSTGLGFILIGGSVLTIVTVAIVATITYIKYGSL